MTTQYKVWLWFEESQQGSQEQQLIFDCNQKSLYGNTTHYTCCSVNKLDEKWGVLNSPSSFVEKPYHNQSRTN